MLKIERTIKNKYLPQMRDAKLRGDDSKEREIRQDYTLEMYEIEQWQRSLIQDKLIRKARQLSLVIPTKDTKKLMEDYEDENWECNFGDYFLKDHALVNLRREVRREQKERQELWMPMIALLTAFIGSATAFFSVWVVWFSK